MIIFNSKIHRKHKHTMNNFHNFNSSTFTKTEKKNKTKEKLIPTEKDKFEHSIKNIFHKTIKYMKTHFLIFKKYMKLQ